MRGKGFALFLALAQREFGAETVNSAAPSRVAALNADGSALVRENRYAEAEVAYRTALRACATPDEGSHCRELPAVLGNLGTLYFQTGRLREAELELVRAVQYGSSNPKPSEELGSALYNLAAVYRAQARYTEAAPLYDRALAVREELLGPQELPLVPLLNGMALLYNDTAEYTRAQRILERAVSIIELRHARNTSDAATTFATLGTVLEAQGNVKEAETWVRNALEIRQRLFGQNSVVADTQVGLALIFHRENRLTEAADLDSRAIATYQELHEAKNLPVALNNLGRIRVEQGRSKEAERLFRKAIAFWEKELGPMHPNVAAGLTNLGLLLSSRSKFDEAEPILHRARDIDQERFPASHPRIANDLNNLAVLALNRKQYPEAEALLQEAKAIFEKCLSPGHPDTGKVLARLAEVYHREGRLDEAETLYRRSLEILERAWGTENPLLLSLLENYSADLRSQQNYADAASLDARSMKIRVKQALRRSQ